MRIVASGSFTLVVLAAALLPLGCRSSAVEEPPRTAMVEQGPPPPTTPVTGELAIGDAPPQPSSAPPLPEKRRHPGNDSAPRPAPLPIGAACPEPAPSPQPGSPVGASPCGTKGRVALVWDSFSASLGRSAPCKLVPVGKAKDPGAYLPSACVKDGKLYAQSRCVMCRMVDAGSSAVALIGEMTREQAIACQRMLGLPATDPLLSEDVWAKAIAAARS